MKTPLLPLTKRGNEDGHVALAHQLKLMDFRGIETAEEAGVLRFGEYTIEGCDEPTTLWGIGDPNPRQRVGEFRHLAGPWLQESDGSIFEGHRYGDLSHPIGADRIRLGHDVALVIGVENYLAACSFFWSCRNVSIAVMLEPVEIAAWATKLFPGRRVHLCDLGCPTDKPGYDLYRQQLAGISSEVRTLLPTTEKFADGSPVLSLHDSSRAKWEAQRARFFADIAEEKDLAI